LDGDDGSAGERGQVSLYVNMVFQLPVEFGLPEQEVAQLALGAERAIFEKPSKLGHHMKPL
jgi:hypothetical protein